MNKRPIESALKKWSFSDSHYSSYEDLVGSLGVEIILWRSDEDYQGDSYVAVKDGDRYGYLTFGWGSCSGCDALEACSSVDEFSALRDDLEGGITWFDSLPEFKDYVANDKNLNDLSWRSTEAMKDFKKEVAELA